MLERRTGQPGFTKDVQHPGLEHALQHPGTEPLDQRPEALRPSPSTRRGVKGASDGPHRGHAAAKGIQERGLNGSRIDDAAEIEQRAGHRGHGQASPVDHVARWTAMDDEVVPGGTPGGRDLHGRGPCPVEAPQAGSGTMGGGGSASRPQAGREQLLFPGDGCTLDPVHRRQGAVPSALTHPSLYGPLREACFDHLSSCDEPVLPGRKARCPQVRPTFGS